MAKCPNCNSQIDDDSRYCDQCGKEMYVCPRCNKIGKGQGKRCSNCGSELVAASQLSQQPQQPQPQSQQQQPQQGFQQPQGFYQPQQQHTAGHPQASIIPGNAPQGTSLPKRMPSALQCRELGIIMQLADGAIIGRDYSSIYAPMLQNLQSMSRLHAKLVKNGNQWFIIDTSSFGTAINGVKCNKNQNYPFKTGDLITFAQIYNFIVI